MDRVGVGSRGQGKVCLVLELQNEFGQEGGVMVKLLAGRGASGTGLAPFGEDTTGQERVRAAIVGHDAKARRQRAVYADAQQIERRPGTRLRRSLRRWLFVGAGVDASSSGWLKGQPPAGTGRWSGGVLE